MMADKSNINKLMDDDSFLDWETRDESIPFHKHIIAGKAPTRMMNDRVDGRHHGTRGHVSSRHCQSKYHIQ